MYIWTFELLIVPNLHGWTSHWILAMHSFCLPVFFSAMILINFEHITLIGVNLSVLLHAPCFWLLFYIYLSQGQYNARQRHKRMVTPSILVTDCKYSFLLFATIYLLANPLRWAGAVQCYTSLDIILPFKMLPHWTLLRWAGPHQAKPVAPPPRSSLPLLPKLLSYTLPNLHFVFLPSVKALPRSFPSSPLGLFVKSFLLISFSLYLFISESLLMSAPLLLILILPPSFHFPVVNQLPQLPDPRLFVVAIYFPHNALQCDNVYINWDALYKCWCWCSNTCRSAPKSLGRANAICSPNFLSYWLLIVQCPITTEILEHVLVPSFQIP